MSAPKTKPSMRSLASAACALLFGLLAASSAYAQEVVEYYATDQLGSIRVVFDAGGTIVSRADYLPFGEELAAFGPMPAEHFTGQARDGEAGMDYFHARQYQPRTGRFSSVDPVYAGTFDPQQWNRYSYVANRPTVATDPDGRNLMYVIPNLMCITGYCAQAEEPNGSGGYTDFLKWLVSSVLDMVPSTVVVGGQDADLLPLEPKYDPGPLVGAAVQGGALVAAILIPGGQGESGLSKAAAKDLGN